MKLLQSLLLPALAGAAAAAAATDATVYLFPSTESPNSPNTPALSAEQARLVFAQRLGASRYHGLGDASESTISYINLFGGHQKSLFQDQARDKAAELVIIVEGASSQAIEPLLNAWASYKPAFTIAAPPSTAANTRLVSDLRLQLGSQDEECQKQDLESAINPLDATCWRAKAKVIHFDLGGEKSEAKVDELMVVQRKLLRYAENEDMNTMVVLMPESSRSSNGVKNPYGSYETAIQSQVVRARGRSAEEPMTESPVVLPTPKQLSQQASSSSSKNLSRSASKPIRGVLPACFASRDICMSMTNNCSARGECYKKFGNVDSKGGCFTCGCRAQNQTFAFDGKNRTTLTYWGGAACQKEDISSPFWLITIFSVVMVGLVTWGVGLMYSIGDEKLPGVIGAGVSSSKAR